MLFIGCRSNCPFRRLKEYLGVSSCQLCLTVVMVGLDRSQFSCINRGATLATMLITSLLLSNNINNRYQGDPSSFWMKCTCCLLHCKSFSASRDLGQTSVMSRPALEQTSLWMKKYFIFVSPQEYLQREHYWSSFRLLLSSRFLFMCSLSSHSFSFTVILSLSGSVKAPGDCEGSDSHTIPSQSRLEWWVQWCKGKKSLPLASFSSLGLGWFPRKSSTITFKDATCGHAHNSKMNPSSMQDATKLMCFKGETPTIENPIMSFKRHRVQW